MLKNSSKFQRIWIYLILLNSPIYLRTGSEGVEFIDIIFAAFYFGTLYFWFFWTLFVAKKSIFRNIADFFLLTFFVLGFALALNSYLNGVHLVDSMRELVLISFVLYYFPIRENFAEKKHLIFFSIIFSIAIFLNSLGQIYDYYRNISAGLQYAYQLLSSTKIRINQTLFSFTILSSSLFMLIKQKLLTRIWLVISIISSSIALLTTFSRTFWLITLLVFGVYIVVLPFKHKIRLGLSGILVLGSIFLVSQLFFKERSDVVIQVIEKRFLSTSKGIKDLSLTARLKEYQTVIQKIKEYPIQGNGFFKEFRFYSVLEQETATTTTIHNGYLFLFYRVGIPLGLMFIFCVFYFFIKSLKNIYLIDDVFYKFVSVAALTGLIVMIISGFTSSQFLYRDGTFLFAVSFALVEISYNQVQIIRNKRLILQNG